MTSLNMDLAVARRQDPATWLKQTDIMARADFFAACGRRDYDQAFTRMHAHLIRTETTRRHIQGDGPAWDDALETFEGVVHHHVLAGLELRDQLGDRIHVGGVKLSPPHMTSGGDQGSKDTHKAAHHDAAGASCASDGPHLQLVPPPACGAVGAIAHMRCVSATGHEFGHYFQSSTGSELPSKHGQDQP